MTKEMGVDFDGQFLTVVIDLEDESSPLPAQIIEYVIELMEKRAMRAVRMNDFDAVRWWMVHLDEVRRVYEELTYEPF